MSRPVGSLRCLVGASWLLVVGCGSSDAADGGKSDSAYQAEVVSGIHSLVADDLAELEAASSDLRAALPQPTDRGWDASLDAAAIASARSVWQRARTAYELDEGMVAPLYPEADYAVDARYDDYLADLGTSGDADLFDGQGVTGLHAIERILWAGEAPAGVVALEASLPGYVAAAFPATAAESAELDTGLAAQLVTDVQALRGEWTPLSIHVAIAFQGLVSLMNEQREKVRKAASSEEESRYSQRTLADLRDNLRGTRRAYGLFQGWLRSKSQGKAIDAQILAGFDELDAAYGEPTGDAIPAPPATWSSENPSAADRETPFGKLYTAVESAVDPNRAGSVVEQMEAAATLLGFPPVAP